MSTPARRTRTGCKTCRQRKLKCDETKPICGQCRKSNRECQPSEGIAFRHAQNAGFVDKNGGDDLANFYKYRQKFNNTYFLPIPRELSFIQVTDPYATEESSAQASSQSMSQTHPTQYPLPPMPQQSNPQYVDVAASSLKAMIDPNLEASQDPGHKGDNLLIQPDGSVPTSADVAEADNINETIMKALRNTNEHVKGL